jgi:mannose-6-phosphate isomerase-like protein (cupin superfamily)
MSDLSSMNGNPRVVWMPGGVRTEVRLAGDDTGGAFCLLVDHPPAGWAIPPHLHRREAETIHVTEGEFEMQVDGQRYRIAAGQTIHVPRGVVQSSRNVDAATGGRIVIFSPAGIERFFLEAGAPTADAAVDLAAALAAATRYGWKFVAFRESA